jgi:hypothetical protein
MVNPRKGGQTTAKARYYSIDEGAGQEATVQPKETLWSACRGHFRDGKHATCTGRDIDDLPCNQNCVENSKSGTVSSFGET